MGKRTKGGGLLTLYNQFRSKTGLLEAVYDDIGSRGGIGGRLSEAFGETDPKRCLDAVVEAFLKFWNAERLPLRRLRSLAVLNPDFTGVTQRDEWRRRALKSALSRVRSRKGSREHSGEILDTLTMLTSFETFDTLARAGAPLPRIVERIQRLVRLALQDRGTSPGKAMHDPLLPGDAPRD